VKIVSLVMIEHYLPRSFIYVVTYVSQMSLISVLATLDGIDSVDACPSRQWRSSPSSIPQFNVVIILRNPFHRIISHVRFVVDSIHLS
jgi:hypothetical protein